MPYRPSNTLSLSLRNSPCSVYPREDGNLFTISNYQNGEEFGIVKCSLSSQEKSSLMRPSGLKLKEDKDSLENKFNNSSRFSVPQSGICKAPHIRSSTWRPGTCFRDGQQAKGCWNECSFGWYPAFLGWVHQKSSKSRRRSLTCGFHMLNHSTGFPSFTMHNSFSSQGNIFLWVQLCYMHVLKSPWIDMVAS